MSDSLINFFNLFVRSYYDQPHRAYHTPMHIRHMLFLADNHHMNLSTEQLLAVLFHDAVYIPGCSENESLSAQLLDTIYAQHSKVFCPKFEMANTSTVKQIILDTKTHVPTIPESAAVLDLDMAILGAPWEGYKEYMCQIQFEFIRFVGQTFYEGRKKFLSESIDKPVFHTQLFIDLFEKQAKENMERELKELG